LGDDYRDKWDMTAGYFSIAVLIFVTGMVVMGKIKRQLPLLQFLGKNSLLFLFCHYLVLRTVAHAGLHRWMPVWIMNTILTVLLMKVLLMINRYLIELTKINLQNPLPWGIVLIIILINPLVNSSDWVYRLSYPLGFFISMNYHQLLALVADGRRHRGHRAVLRH